MAVADAYCFPHMYVLFVVLDSMTICQEHSLCSSHTSSLLGSPRGAGVWNVAAVLVVFLMHVAVQLCPLCCCNAVVGADAGLLLYCCCCIGFQLIVVFTLIMVHFDHRVLSCSS